MVFLCEALYEGYQLMRYSKIFVDVSNFYHRGYSTGQEMTNVMEDGFEMITGGIHNSLQMIQRIEREYLMMGGEMFFLFDNCHSGVSRRRVIDPDYKKNREKREEAFFKGLDFFHLILLAYKDTYRTVKMEGMEADDLVAPLVDLYPDDSILLVSNDMDWFRKISDNVHVAKYENKNYKIYNKEIFFKKFNFEPTSNKICLFKSFRGDDGDNVPIGVKGIRTDTLIKLIQDHDTISDICRSVDHLDYVSDLFKKKIKESTPRLLMNYKLVDFLPITVEEIQENIYYSAFKPATLNQLYLTLGFDIGHIDSRVYQFFPKARQSGSFFKKEKIPRA